MLNFATVYNHGEQSMRGVASSKQNAVVMSFPYALLKSTIDHAPMTVETDIINYRMKAPLNSEEMAAVIGMVDAVGQPQQSIRNEHNFREAA